MDHADALERIELAAVDPDGLDRLMAGDTPDGGAVAGHLAGCPACVGELGRIRRTATAVREAVASAPDPALRERTLVFVRAVGRDRSADTMRPVTAAPVRPASGRPAWQRWGALAAALALAAGLGFGAAAVRSQEGRLADEVSVLQAVAATSMRIESRPDTIRLALTATATGGTAWGTLLVSPSLGELVMTAEGLAPLRPGEEYGCWVEVGGTRTRIGRMYEGGDLRGWAGPVSGLSGIPADAVFGVSRVPAGGGSGEPVLLAGG